MTSFKPLFAVIGALILAGPFVAAQAQETVAACGGISAEDARLAAREAEKLGDNDRAAECFVVAGDNVRANRAMLRAAVDTNEAAKKKASIAAATARNQARQLRAAFR